MGLRLPIPYSRQNITDDDIQAVITTLRSDWLTQGPKVKEFEKALAEYCGAEYAVAVCNGTAALHLAMLATGLNSGDEVITTPNTFVATTNAIIHAGAIPILADIQAETFNIDPEEIVKRSSAYRKVKGIVPVYFAGLPADMEAIHEIARTHNLWVVDDACHALGGKWLDSSGVEHTIGDCSHSDMTVFSFHPVKQVTSGEGGAILTNDKMLYEKLRSLRNHGITKDPGLFQSRGYWYYEMHELGFNYRMSDIHAALGLQQLKRNDVWVERRRKLVHQYDRAFAEIADIRHQVHPDNGRVSYHLYVIQSSRRRQIYEYLREKGILTQVHYIPVHFHPYYQEHFGYQIGQYPMAEEYYSKALSLPMFPGLTDEEQEYVISSVMECLL